MGRARLLYDGDCGLCVRSVRRLAALGGARLELVDFRKTDPARLDARLTPAACAARVQLLEDGGRLTEGFGALRRLSVLLPLLWPLAPVLHLPGMGVLGPFAYDKIAHWRFRLSAALGLE